MTIASASGESSARRSTSHALATICMFMPMKKARVPSHSHRKSRRAKRSSILDPETLFLSDATRPGGRAGDRRLACQCLLAQDRSSYWAARRRVRREEAYTPPTGASTRVIVGAGRRPFMVRQAHHERDRATTSGLGPATPSKLHGLGWAPPGSMIPPGPVELPGGGPPFVWARISADRPHSSVYDDKGGCPKRSLPVPCTLRRCPILDWERRP